MIRPKNISVFFYLSVIDNPRQDIPFYGFLKLPFMDFSETDLALIKILYRYGKEKEEQERKEK